MPEADPAEPRLPFAARLFSGALALLAVQLAILGGARLLASPESLWRGLLGRPLAWDDPGPLLLSFAAFGLAGGAAFALAEEAVARGRWPCALAAHAALTLVALWFAAYWGEAARTASLLRAAPLALDLLRTTLPWETGQRWLVYGVAVYAPLVAARRRGAPPREASLAMALGGAAYALAYSDPRLVLAPSALRALASPASAFSPVFSYSHYAALDVLLWASFLPALLAPGALSLSERLAARGLALLGQPAPASPPPVRWRPRAWGAALLARLRTDREASPPSLRAQCAHVRERLQALREEHGPLLTALGLFLAWTGVVREGVWFASPEVGFARAAGDSLLVLGALASLVVARKVQRSEHALRVFGGGLAILLFFFLVRWGSREAAFAVSTGLCAALAARRVPALAALLLLCAWPTTSRYWPCLPLGGCPFPKETWVFALAGLSALALWFAAAGRASLPQAAGAVLGALAGRILAAQALWSLWTDPEVRIWTAEAALAGGLAGGLWGVWASRGGRRRALVAGALGLALAVGGLAFLRGDPLEDLATRRLRRAAEAGDPAAMLHLAERLEVGVGTLHGTPRTQEALDWYRRAAEAGDAEAMLRLGLRLCDGRAPYDPEAGRHWIERAAAEGNQRALEHVARLRRGAEGS
ncbi:MAG: sel1 repeat family protein [Planctomycetota bacterium]|nr:MAG: sel1 repeat family protein [Planctomycetota bacterium]